MCEQSKEIAKRRIRMKTTILKTNGEKIQCKVKRRASERDGKIILRIKCTMKCNVQFFDYILFCVRTQCSMVSIAHEACILCLFLMHVHIAYLFGRSICQVASCLRSLWHCYIHCLKCIQIYIQIDRYIRIVCTGDVYVRSECNRKYAKARCQRVVNGAWYVI